MRTGSSLLLSRRSTQWLCLAAAIAIISCGGDSRTTLDVRLVLSGSAGSIDQIQVQSVLVDGTALDLNGEETRFPETPRMLVTGDVLTIKFAASAGGKVVTVTAVGLRCGQAVTDAATTMPRTIATAASTPVDLTLAVTRSAGCDGGVDGSGGRGGGGGSAVGGRGGAAGTAGTGGASGTGGTPSTGGTGGSSAAGGTGGVAGTGGGAGTGGAVGTAGRGGTGAAAGTSGTGGSAAGTGGRGGTGVAGTGGRGGSGVAGTGGGGGTTKPNGMTCGGGAECTSGNCVDGVCCDTPLANCGGCRACNLSSSPGTCANVPNGTDPHNACPASMTNCAAGGCTAGACTPAVNTVVCSSVCGGTNQLMTKLCNGATTGCTNAANTSACPGNLVCASATACMSSCTSDTNCVSGYYCATGSCTAKLGNGQACSSANQCASGACTGFHRDADGDGYGVAATTSLCGSSPPTGYVTNATDCCDADQNVRPGQTGWFTSGSAACGGTFDYNCANGPELQHGSGIGSCMTIGLCTVNDPSICYSTPGWLAPVPGCGGSGTYLSSCNSAPSECTPNCPDPGSCGRNCGAAVTAPRTQGCH